jgi:hypothetical protein
MMSLKNTPGVLAVALALSLLVVPCYAQNRLADNVFVSEDPSTEEFFGRSLASDGEWLFASSHISTVQGVREAGKIVVYRRGPGGFVWFQNIESPAPFPAEILGGNGFAVDGDFFVVGSPAFPDEFNPEGRAYVYRFDGVRWTLDGILKQAVSAPRDGYAKTIAMTGETVFVGAPGGGTASNGTIYIYRRIQGAWTEIQVWSPPLPIKVGEAIAANGDVFVSASERARRADILERNASGLWVHTQALDSITVLVNDQREWAVDALGETIAIGMDETNAILPGSVVVLDRVAGLWTEVAVLQAPDSNGRGDRFGFAVDLEGNRLIVGAPDAVSPPGTMQAGWDAPGAAYVYERDSSGIFQFQWKLVREDSSRLEELGYSVTLSGDNAVVGDRLGVMAPGHLPGDGYVAVFDLPMGDEICSGVANSTGVAAWIEVLGSKAASEGFVRLRAGGLPSGLAGLFLGAKATGFVANPGGSQGNLCLGGSIARFNRGGQYGAPGANGTFELELNTQHLPFSPGVPILAGESWTFQFWYRDLNAGQNTNFSSAVEVLFE